MPFELARKHPDLITELSPYAFHYPLWDTNGLALLFEQVANFPQAYVHHLWQGNSSEKYLSHLSIQRIQNEEVHL